MTVGIGLVGSGFMSRTYAECLRAHTSGGRLVAVTAGRRASALAADYGVDLEPTLDSMLARQGLQAVILGTPHSTHVGQTKQAAAAGKHVYVEKPMALNVGECDEMIEACRAGGVKLTVNKVTRFRESPTTAHRLIDEGKIGQLRMIRILCSVVSLRGVSGYAQGGGWATDPAEGGLILDMGAHVFDALRWYTGAEASAIYARLTDFEPGGGHGKSGMVQVVMANGVMAQFWMSFEMPQPGLGSQAQWILVGSDGIIDCDNYGKVRLGRGETWEEVYEMPSFGLASDTTSPVRLKAFAAQVQDFIEAIRDDRDPLVSGADGRAAIEMVDAARLSAETGRAVHLPLRS